MKRITWKVDGAVFAMEAEGFTMNPGPRGIELFCLSPSDVDDDLWLNRIFGIVLPEGTEFEVTEIGKGGGGAEP